MTRLLHIALVAACTLIGGCYVAPYPYPAPAPAYQTVVSPPNFDKSWDAALGAATDVGIQITNADRTVGAALGGAIALDPAQYTTS